HACAQAVVLDTVWRPYAGSQGLRAQARRARQAVPLSLPVASRQRKATGDTEVDLNAWGCSVWHPSSSRPLGRRHRDRLWADGACDHQPLGDLRDRPVAPEIFLYRDQFEPCLSPPDAAVPGPTGPAIINPWGLFAIVLSSLRFFCTGTRSSPASPVSTVTWQVPAVVCQSVEGAPYLLRPSSRHDFRSNPLSPTWLWPVGV